MTDQARGAVQPSPETVPGVRSDDTQTLDVQRVARIAGLRSFTTPTLEEVERRRFELLGVTSFLLVALSIGIVVTSYLGISPDWLDAFGGTATVVRVAIVLLAVSFSVYVFDKERNLRKLSKVLINERVLGAALSNRLKEISLLTEAGKAVISTLELDDVLGVILNAAFELLEADEGSVMLVVGSDLVVAAAVGRSRFFVGDRHRLSEGLAGHVARTREPLLIEGSPDLSEFASVIAGDKPPILSAMSVPLEAKGELLGVLNLNVMSGDRRYDEYDLRALGLFAEHAAMAISHARILRREREMRVHIADLDRIRAELVASMAHDLKSPLTTILGAGKTLAARADEIEPGKRQELYESVTVQAQRLLGLIERLLEAARSQAQHLPLSPGHVDVVPLAQEIAESYSSAHGRHVTVDTDAPHVFAYADREALEQVLSNLLENANKYTPPSGAVGLTVRSDGRDVSIDVRDEGEGIDEDDLPHLFMPFRRGRGGGTGVGLGLFIVSNLVRAMGGEITAASAAGEGTTFSFTLPAEARARAEDGA